VSYNGNYSKFIEQRRLRLALWKEKHEKQTRFVADEERWIKKAKGDDALAPQATAKTQALKKLKEGEDWVERPPKDKRFRFRFPPAPRCGESVVEVTVPFCSSVLFAICLHVLPVLILCLASSRCLYYKFVLTLFYSCVRYTPSGGGAAPRLRRRQVQDPVRRRGVPRAEGRPRGLRGPQRCVTECVTDVMMRDYRHECSNSDRWHECSNSYSTFLLARYLVSLASLNKRALKSTSSISTL
jgi:hypothetical protein